MSKSFERDRSLRQAYLSLAAFAAKIKCGHTYPNFFNQPKAVADALFKGQTRVPFYFEWIDDRMVVTADFTPYHAIPRGSEILEINGRPVGTILKSLLTVARADGANDFKRVASLGVRGDAAYEAFDIYFPMFFPQTSTRMEFLVRKPGAVTLERIEAQALTYAQRAASRPQAGKGPQGELFEWTYLATNAAYLRMPTWALYDIKWDWKSWLNAHLDDLAQKQTPALILDIRGNEGGLDVGNVILSRIAPEKMDAPGLVRLVRYRKVPDDLAPFLDTWDPSFKDWGTAASPLLRPWPTAPALQYFELARSDEPPPDHEEVRGKHYSGKVFVLVDSNNSSATFQFAQTVQRNKLGVLVGEPTGGNQRGINGGAFFFLRLPNSKIEMDLPLIGTFPAAPMPDAGLTPDVIVRRSAADIDGGIDPVMVAVERILKASGP